MQEFHVGLPCLKLSLNPSNQRHHGKAARTCSVSDAWREMNDERKGRDRTIDHSLTPDNAWLCGNTDMDVPGIIQAEIDRINAERADHGKRKMRLDAVSAIELIQKPPMELMETLTREEQTKLLQDSDRVVESILHDWCPEWKTIATVIHFDEFGGKSGHPHKIFMPIARDDDGCPVLNAKRDFNLKFFTFMNREYPA
ncbi:MAG: plasmid recombination protein, partial [Lachnospiraceae bacterium]|nr:plasmid recombination protein [Lachnospiraceae bacterium]